MDLPSWDDLRFILAVAEHGTLTAAATSLDVDQTTVTRRLRMCEARVGTPLFRRIRGGVSLTPTGEAFVRAAAEVEDRLFALQREVSSTSVGLGPVRLTLSPPLAMLWIDDLVEFARMHPKLRLELIVDDDFRNLDRREADVALRRTHEPPEHLVGRKLCPIADALYGAPSLADVPVDQLPWIGWEYGLDSSALEAARVQYSPSQSFTLYANSLLVLFAAAERGHTTVRLACAIGDANPRLVRLTEPAISNKNLWVLTHPESRRSPSVRLVMDFVARLVGKQKDALAGRRS